jgi:hypothetical protein
MLWSLLLPLFQSGTHERTDPLQMLLTNNTPRRVRPVCGVLTHRTGAKHEKGPRYGRKRGPQMWCVPDRPISRRGDKGDRQPDLGIIIRSPKGSRCDPQHLVLRGT